MMDAFPVVSRLQDLGGADVPLFLAAGFFDGVHRGHQAVILRAVELARAQGGAAWVFTFDRHPATILRPASAPPLLTTNAQKLAQFAALGADGCLMLPFTPELATHTPDVFLRELRAAAPRLAGLVAGQSWHFGLRAAGNAEFLRRHAEEFGIAAHVVEPVFWEGAPISSSRVRDAVITGQLAGAAAMLGRPPALQGRVVPGKRFGRQLGFPTANIELPGMVTPPAGVYVVESEWADAPLIGAAFMPGQGGFIEAHFLDADLDVYGQTLEVRLLRRLRANRRFETPGALRAQIARDVLEVRKWIRANKPPADPDAGESERT